MFDLLPLATRMPPDRADPFGPAQPEHPPHHVEHVDAHVPDDAVAVLHERPPAAGVGDRVIRTHRSRAGPHLPVEVVGRVRVRRIRIVAHVIVAIDLDHRDLAELPLADDLVARLDQVGRAPALGAHLDDALVFPRRGQHGLALGHVHADRLLDVDVGPGFDGGDHRQRVPVVGRGDQDDVQVLLLEHLAIVGIGARGLLRGLARGGHLGGMGEHLLVDVAEGNDLDRSDLDQPEQVGLAVPAGADQPDPLRLRGGGPRGVVTRWPTAPGRPLPPRFAGTRDDS